MGLIMGGGELDALYETQRGRLSVSAKICQGRGDTEKNISLSVSRVVSVIMFPSEEDTNGRRCLLAAPS